MSLKYKVFRPTGKASTITTDTFIEGEALRDIMRGNYQNVTHISKFHPKTPPQTHIIVRESDPENEFEEYNELFVTNGTVVLVEGL